MASLCFQRPPSPRSFGFLVDVVGELRIRGRGFAAQAAGVPMTSLRHRIQLAVDLDVDPAHEEGRYALQSFQRPAAGETLFQPLEKGLEDSAIPLDRRDQGNVDGDASGQSLCDARKPCESGWDLYEKVRAINEPPQSARLGRGSSRVLSDARIHLYRHPPVPPIRARCGGLEHIAGAPDIPGGKESHSLADRRPSQCEVMHLLLIARAGPNRLGENRGVGGDPDDPTVRGQLGQLPDFICVRLRSSNQTATPVLASCCNALIMTTFFVLTELNAAKPAGPMLRKPISDSPGRRAPPLRW